YHAYRYMKNASNKVARKRGRRKRSSLRRVARQCLADNSRRHVTRLFGAHARTKALRRKARCLRASKVWEKWEIELIRDRLPDNEVARQTGRSATAVQD